MGVRGSGGVGGGVPRQRPSHIAYYVALVGILSLLIMLLLYFFYFCIKKVKKLSSVDTPTLTASSYLPPPVTAPAYPVQPVVREGAYEMARLCTQLPPPGKGGTVYPTSTSPAAIRTDTGGPPQTDPVVPEIVVTSIPSVPIIADVAGAPPESQVVKQVPPVSAVEAIESVTAH